MVSVALAVTDGLYIDCNKELQPIVVAYILWGSVWKGQVVVVYCDNTAAVEVVNSGYR